MARPHTCPACQPTYLWLQSSGLAALYLGLRVFWGEVVGGGSSLIPAHLFRTLGSTRVLVGLHFMRAQRSDDARSYSAGTVSRVEASPVAPVASRQPWPLQLKPCWGYSGRLGVIPTSSCFLTVTLGKLLNFSVPECQT